VEPPEPGGERANLDQLAFRQAEVGAYPAGASAYGALGMIGDVWEWTASEFSAYPGFESFPYREYSEIFFDEGYRVLRGGSWATRPGAAARARCRLSPRDRSRSRLSGGRVERRDDPVCARLGLVQQQVDGVGHQLDVAQLLGGYVGDEVVVGPDLALAAHVERLVGVPSREAWQPGSQRRPTPRAPAEVNSFGATMVLPRLHSLPAGDVRCDNALRSRLAGRERGSG
jgi:Sulfatase-modifying factor enzyme 1